MADIGISPNDPIFFMHHTFIDYQWEMFRQQKQTREEREVNIVPFSYHKLSRPTQTQYPPDDLSCNEFHYGTAQMKPFPIQNKDGLSNAYTDELYQYRRVICTLLLE